MRKIIVTLLAGFVALTSVLKADEQQIILTFDEAVRRAFTQSPSLRISESDVQEMNGQLIQSQAYINPLFAYSVENVFGNHDWRGWKSAESRYELSQPIELGGKRGYRSKAATYDYYAAQADYAITSLYLLNQLLNAFVEVVAAQEQLKLAQEQKRISEEILKSVAAKVEAGKVSLIQQNKAEIAYFNAEMEEGKACADLKTAKESLALLWGSTCPDFDAADFPFFEVEVPVPFEHCLSDLRDNPQLLKSYYEYLSAAQNLCLEESSRVPDLVVTLGLKTLHENGDKGMVLGAAIPLPVFDRNQGNIKQARSQVCRTQDQYVFLQQQLENKLSRLHRELIRAYQEAEQLRTTILKAAVQSFELAKEGYNEGKFEYLDMLDSQRTFFEVKEKYIQSLLNYHQRRADIEYQIEI